MPILTAVAAALLQAAPMTSATPDLSWMSGYWLDCSNGREVAETWSEERAGLRVGWNLTVSRSGRAGFEASHITTTQKGFAYVAQPSGAPPTVFVLHDADRQQGRHQFHRGPLHISGGYPARDKEGIGQPGHREE